MDLKKMDPYPLTFTPLMKEKVWGGRRLAEVGKVLPAQGPFGESWELVDLDDDQSMVAAGPAKGIGLHELINAWGPGLMGSAGLDGGRFPLLVKYLDANETLSVQVHPDAEVARRLGGRPKSEAWYILGVEPGGVIYRGLKPGVGRDELAAALAAGEVEQLLAVEQVEPGDLVPVPPGTVHAIGAGVMLAEVQQPSDTTYRVHDWGRNGLDGVPRTLHIQQALQSIHFGVEPPPMVRSGSIPVAMFHFRLVSLDPGQVRDEAVEGPVVLVGLEGLAHIETGPYAARCGLGDVVLLPSACRPAQISASGQGARLLEVIFPRTS
mgnify:CR=1 FL=1